MKHTHLDDSELARLAIEPDALPRRDLAEHLGACPWCREQLETLRADLFRLSTLASAAAPTPIRPVRLPVREPRSCSGSPAFILGACGGALAATVALLLVFWFSGLPLAPGPEQDESRQLLLEDAALLHELHALERDPLPGIVAALIADQGEELEDPFLAFELLEPLFVPGDPFS